MNDIDLVGEAKATGEFPPTRMEPTITVDQVMKAAKWTRKVSMSERPCADKELATEVWEKTSQEMDKKWLSGPYTVEQLKCTLTLCSQSAGDAG